MLQFQPVMVKSQEQSDKPSRKEANTREADNDANPIEAAQAA